MSPEGKEAFRKDDQSGHFIVTAATEGRHQVCLYNNASHPRSALLNIKHAIQVSDHSTIAKKEHVTAIEAELERMKKLADHVKAEMQEVRARSDQQLETNESMRTRLLWVEVAMMLAVLAMGFWQIIYLKRYFRIKKLI